MSLEAARRQLGFTLVELAVTLSVAAILVTVAVPSMSQLMAGQRRVGEVNDLVLALNYARSEAVKQNAAAGVSVSANGSWPGGWSVCCSATGTQLQSLPAINSGSSITATAAGTSITAVSFGANGALFGTQATVLFTFCDSRGASQATAVEVNSLGQIATGATAGYRVDGVTRLTCGG